MDQKINTSKTKAGLVCYQKRKTKCLLHGNFTAHMQPEKEHFSSIFILLKESEFVINVLVFLY